MNSIRRLICLFALAAGLSCAAIPAALASADEKPTAEANAAWEAKDWARAAKLYKELSKEKDAPPRVWLRLGASLRSLGKHEEALAAFDKATQMGAGQFGE